MVRPAASWPSTALTVTRVSRMQGSLACEPGRLAEVKTPCGHCTARNPALLGKPVPSGYQPSACTVSGNRGDTASSQKAASGVLVRHG